MRQILTICDKLFLKQKITNEKKYFAKVVKYVKYDYNVEEGFRNLKD